MLCGSLLIVTFLPKSSVTARGNSLANEISLSPVRPLNIRIPISINEGNLDLLFFITSSSIRVLYHRKNRSFYSKPKRYHRMSISPKKVMLEMTHIR